MGNAFPLRPESHQLEEMSERFFRNSIPRNWTVEKPSQDYGVDLRVDIFENGCATGLELLIQLKASAKSRHGKSESVVLKTSTYNLLWQKLQVAMLVTYVDAEGEAYWLLFRDIPSPPQGQKTFTVHVPKENRVSAAPWDEIVAHVRRVTDTKLASMRRDEMQQGTGDG